ncbi:hypothetical protein DL1_00415 [Thioclava dalianensis]|uniref:Uncharacterized protein n=1 Tax=Thioclava dalianensis TaxID=1185766 RepID=A0A074TJ97_9RHOB|nr:hypothetical protein [Thioclava dalianensis]KEP71766.1 hypothetical protein DL1_00415 [Thioclava dalianensis]SFN45772.1 hypothetical protein SAMN05216224_105302 [Thioclava dalianensis]
MDWNNTEISATERYAAAIVEWKSPVFANAQGSLIDITMNHPIFGAIPFTLDKNDLHAEFDTAQLFDAITAAGNIAPYVAPDETP